MDNNSTAIIIAVIAALGSVSAATIGILNRGKLDVIHVLVNSNLTEIKLKLEKALQDKAAGDVEIERLNEIQK